MTNTEKLKKAVKNYLDNGPLTNAFLINGQWGSGKTFCVIKQLIPFLQIDQEKNKTIPIYISLYGITSLEEISKQIYNKMMPKILETIKPQKTDKIIDTDAAIIENRKKGKLEIFKQYGILAAKSGGKSLLNLLSNKFCISIAEIVDYWEFIDKWNIILVFDDFERARVDLNSLMGYMNNFIEEYGIKTIIIGDEKEIFNEFSYINYSNKVETVKDLELPEIEKKKYLDALKHTGKRTLENTKDYLDAKILYFLNPARKYGRIKEKLIGYTYNFTPDLNYIFSKISAKKPVLLNNISTIVDSFKYYDSQNIRTYIYAESIFDHFHSIVDGIEIDNNNKLEIYKILIYEIFEQSLELKSPRIPKDEFDGLFHSNHYEPATVTIIIHDLVEDYIKSMILNVDKAKDEFTKCNNLIREYKRTYKKDVSIININFLEKDDEYVKSKMKEVLSNLKRNELNIRAYPKFISIIYYYNSIFTKKIKIKPLLEIMKHNISSETDKIGITFDLQRNFQDQTESAIKNMKTILDEIKLHDLNVGNNVLNEMLNEDDWSRKIYDEVYKHANDSTYIENFISYINIIKLNDKLISGKSIDVIHVVDTLNYIYRHNLSEGDFSNEISSLRVLDSKLKTNDKKIIGETHKAALKELKQMLPKWIEDLSKRNKAKL